MNLTCMFVIFLNIKVQIRSCCGKFIIMFLHPIPDSSKHVSRLCHLQYSNKYQEDVIKLFKNVLYDLRLLHQCVLCLIVILVLVLVILLAVLSSFYLTPLIINLKVDPSWDGHLCGLLHWPYHHWPSKPILLEDWNLDCSMLHWPSHQHDS